MKTKFPLPTKGPPYDPKIHARIVVATAVLWNFIRIHDPTDTESGQVNVAGGETVRGVNTEAFEIHEESLGGFISDTEKSRADTRRDDIAEAMWTDYLAILETRRVA